MPLIGSLQRLKGALRVALGGECAPAPQAGLASASTDPPGPVPPAGGSPQADALIRKVLSDIARTPAGRHARLEVACKPGLEVRGDPLRFQTVLAALVHHAVAKAPCGRILVTCSDQGGRLRIAVVDDGVGENRATQESALRPISEQLALRGGSLEVSSRAGEGTTVVAYWPEWRGQQTERAAGSPASTPARTDPAKSAKAEDRPKITSC